MKLNYISFMGLVIMTLLLSNCASISGFQTARTTPEETVVVSPAINLAKAYDLDVDSETTNNDPLIPIVDVTARYGVTENIDIGIKINTTMQFTADMKYQFYGDQESKLALATGPGVGFFVVQIEDNFNVNFHFPLYASYHPKENIHLYLSPRYILQLVPDGRLNYYGFNSGVLFGKRIKFGLDFGYFALEAPEDETISLNNFGATFIFPFGQ